MSYVVTKFDHCHKCLVMLTSDGEYTLHADKARLFESFDEALPYIKGGKLYLSPKPMLGFIGMDPF